MTETAQVTSQPLTREILEQWATDPAGPVALALRQVLLPVEDPIDHPVVFPPTYAGIGYNIDDLADGTKVALIDSVGSQANRLEPLFVCASDDRNAWLVPQIRIRLPEQPCGTCEGCLAGGKSKDCKQPRRPVRHLLDLAHRGADAVVHATPGLSDLATKAFLALRQKGDAGPLTALAPTSLVFGVWDSRGLSAEKRPRLVRAVIRAWDVDELTTSAQYNSVWKDLGEEQKEELTKEANKRKKKLSIVGLKDAPATNLGGIHVRGDIVRNVTVNLVALRGLRGEDTQATREITRYLLGLTLTAATAEIDLYLREGCHLRYGEEDTWTIVPRRGAPIPVDLSSEPARCLVEDFTRDAAEPFRSGWPETLTFDFDMAAAKKLLSKKLADDDPEG